MNILLTGATGFVGTHLRKKYTADKLFCVVNNGKAPLLKEDNVTAIELDLEQAIDIKRLPKDIDLVLHLAQGNVTKFPEGAAGMFSVNTSTTFSLLEYCRSNHIPKFIFASTGSVYGRGDEPHKEDAVCRPEDFYSISKLAAEMLIKPYAQYFDAVCMRIFLPYGPHQTGRLIPALINRVKNGQTATITNGGQPALNPIYVDDLLVIIKKLIELKGYNIVNVGGEKAYTIHDMVQIIGKVLNIEPVYEFITDPGNQGNVIGDISKLKSLIDYSQRIDLESGIRSMV
jgi:UDP-glucose 4-epimerase